MTFRLSNRRRRNTIRHVERENQNAQPVTPLPQHRNRLKMRNGWRFVSYEWLGDTHSQNAQAYTITLSTLKRGAAYP